MAGGSKEGRREIGRLNVANISDCADVSSYEIRLTNWQGDVGGTMMIELQVDGHRRDDGFWPLIHKALSKAIDEGLVPCASRN